jgi:3-hydroxy-9,10-secoandrosta-1,3,5(10)-triene-9,17-dione monooxygenase
MPALRPHQASSFCGFVPYSKVPTMNVAATLEPASAHADVVAAAAALVPTLRSRSSETDKLARLPDATIADFEKARLFDMLVPTIYGGLQCPLRTYMDAVVQVGRGDGSAAWTVALLSVGTWMVTTFYPKQVVDDVYSGLGTLRSATVLSPGKVKTRPVVGGILIEEGLWRYNSGVHHARLDNLGIPIHDEAGQFVGRGTALIPTSQINLLNDWDTIGLRGSGSTSVTVKDVFVPNERIALLSKVLQEDYPSAHLPARLYRLPLVPLLATNLVFPALGMAKAALELFLEKAPNRGIAFTRYEKQDEASVTHLQVGEVSANIDTAELILKRSVDDLEANAVCGTPMTREQRARIWRDAGFASRLLWEALDKLAAASGVSFAQTANPMNRLWRDARVASLQGAINTSTTMELFGRILSGKEPNTALL